MPILMKSKHKKLNNINTIYSTNIVHTKFSVYGINVIINNISSY